MLKLQDFFHLPQVDALVEQLVADEPGLLIVAGLDPRPDSVTTTGGGFLPSGRTTIFRILIREMLDAHPSARCIVVTEDRYIVRIPRQFRRRINVLPVQPPHTYAQRIAEAVAHRPELLVIDRLCSENAPAALAAAQKGLRVLSQLDTVFRGAGVTRHVLDLDVDQEALNAVLTWVLAVQRLPTLCSHCKQPAPLEPAYLTRLRYRYPHLDNLSLPLSYDAGKEPAQEPQEDRIDAYFRAEGCPQCAHTGRHGDVMVFDVFRADPDAPDPFGQLSILPMEAYVGRLARLGFLSLGDFFRFEADQFHHTYNQLITSERALVEANTTLERKLAEIEAANRVLEQRTKALISLQDIGQTLISSTSLRDLAQRVCRYACDLCGADRALLYFLHTPDQAEVLAVSGWDPALVRRQVDPDVVLDARAGPEPTPFDRWPPGVSGDSADTVGVTLRAGLSVPLFSQNERVGLMLVHTTQKNRFEPGEVALLQTFANQAALAIQRAGLIEQLRAKIDQLEAAQAELAQKERMERELELARQVQQSVLPRTFPLIPGFRFAARNEPARQVGGDFYDVIALDADHFGVAIADVSGKGMPAALYMALTRSLLLAEARRELSPCAVIANVNQLLLELGEPNMFVTIFYGIFERATRRLTYTRAGHDRPLLLRNGDVQALGGQGTLLGLLDKDNLRLSEEQIVLDSGDRLVLYTDGMTDILSPDDQLFDQARLRSLLQSYTDLPPDELCAAIFDDLATYRGTAEQFDDMTMLVVGVE
jgi:serine phosphatase RsbU (regulator of sigma subunit)